MPNKKIIKELIANNLDKKKVKVEILKKKCNPKKSKMWYLIPTSLAIFILFINIIPKMSPENMKNKPICAITTDGQEVNEKQDNAKDFIVYNSLDDKNTLPGETGILAVTSSSSDIKYIEYDDFEYLVLPYYLYNRQDQDVIYEEDKGTCRLHLKYHETIFKDDEEKRAIKIAYSSLAWPTVKYNLDFTTTEKSLINGYEVAIYKEGNNLIASFYHETMYYEIDAVDIDEATFLTILKSIVK